MLKGVFGKFGELPVYIDGTSDSYDIKSIIFFKIKNNKTKKEKKK